jgi:hypothetical protein
MALRHVISTGTLRSLPVSTRRVRKRRENDSESDETISSFEFDETETSESEFEFNAPSKLKLTMHHQFPGVELVSPVYAGYGIECYSSPDQRVDFGSTTRAGFDIDSGQKASIGVLMYKLQGKNMYQFNDEEAKHMELVVIWKVYRSEFDVYPFITEHEKDDILERKRLLKLARNYRPNNVQNNSTENTWFMDDHTVLMIRLNVNHEEECYKLEMTLSETSIRDDTQRPWYFDEDM